MSTFQKYYNDPDYRQYHLSRQKEKIICPGCGANINRSGYSAHIKTDKHINNLRDNNDRLSNSESEQANIERIFNKKIRALERKRDIKINMVQQRLTLIR